MAKPEVPSLSAVLPMAMTTGQALRQAGKRVENVDARLLLQHTLNASHAHLAAHPERLLTSIELAEFQKLVDRRAADEPVAYLTGQREFFGLEFKVTPAVLIPRPETELLVELALERIPLNESCRVVDLGTGSGAIAIAIKTHRPRAHVIATDISPRALQVAENNARRLLAPDLEAESELAARAASASTRPRQGRGCKSEPTLAARGEDRCRPRAGEEPRRERGVQKITFLESDWFDALADRRFDLIVANPPYVGAQDTHLCHGDVRFEPRSALVGGDDGLQCLRHIAKNAPSYLNSGGWLLVEHGFDQAGACAGLLKGAGFKQIFFSRDLAGIPRIAGGRCS